jgi:hypothetical protein
MLYCCRYMQQWYSSNSCHHLCIPRHSSSVLKVRTEHNPGQPCITTWHVVLSEVETAGIMQLQQHAMIILLMLPTVSNRSLFLLIPGTLLYKFAAWPVWLLQAINSMTTRGFCHLPGVVLDVASLAAGLFCWHCIMHKHQWPQCTCQCDSVTTAYSWVLINDSTKTVSGPDNSSITGGGQSSSVVPSWCAF